MEASASIVNAKKSIKKYFIDTIETQNGVNLIFDKWISQEFFQGKTNGEWIFVKFQNPIIDTVSSVDVLFACSTIRDPEGENLSKLQDFIVESLQETGSDRKVIDFYDTSLDPWSIIGGITFSKPKGDFESIGDDNVNIALITVTAIWGSIA